MHARPSLRPRLDAGRTPSLALTLALAGCTALTAFTARAAGAQRPPVEIERHEATIIQPVPPASEVRPTPPAPTGRGGNGPASRSSCPAPRPGNAVEPLSNGFQLYWTKGQAQAAMGGRQTGWDSRTLEIDGATVMFGGAREAIWHYTIQRPGLCLNSGVGVGSTMEDVRRAFGTPYPETLGQYKLQVRYSGAAVREIQIDPVSEFAPVRGESRPNSGGGDVRPPAPTPTPAPSPTGGQAGLGALVGDWYLTQSPSQITIGRDGSYTSSVGGRGTVRVRGSEVTFTGPLASWNGGRATLTDKGYIEFYWKGADGATYWFTFVRR